MTTNNEVFIIGDIYNGLDNNKRYKLIEKFNTKDVIGLNGCKECKLYNVCDGGCVANNFLNNNNVNILSDMYCYWQQILLDEAIYISNVLGEDKNIIFKEIYFKNKG